jgi:hypothetical protein
VETMQMSSWPTVSSRRGVRIMCAAGVDDHGVKGGVAGLGGSSSSSTERPADPPHRRSKPQPASQLNARSARALAGALGPLSEGSACHGVPSAEPGAAPASGRQRTIRASAGAQIGFSSRLTIRPEELVRYRVPFPAATITAGRTDTAAALSSH